MLPFFGRALAFVGTFGGFTKERLQRLVEENGGCVRAAAAAVVAPIDSLATGDQIFVELDATAHLGAW